MTSRELKQSIKDEIMATNDTVEYCIANALIDPKDSNMRFMLKLGEAYAQAHKDDNAELRNLYHYQSLRMVYKDRK